MEQIALVHYNEIATKGNNRSFFEKTLTKNITKAMSSEAQSIERIYGKIVINLKPKHNKTIAKQILKKIPGIAYFTFAHKINLDESEIKNKTLEVLESQTFNTFRVSAKRTYKKYPPTSQQINKNLGKTIGETLNKKVNLKNPDLEVFIEISEKNAFIYFDKFKGVGGLPVGTTGKVISSLSGGIDSPVSSFMSMKRGTEVVLAHAFNKTINQPSMLSKIEEITKQLSKFQPNSKLYIVPFDKIQKEIIAHIPDYLRMIVYRRFMNKILNEIATVENAKAIITGDNLGQVASQTLENLTCIHESSILPILSPLIGFNKEEIINVAKEIETYELSILPYEDCCSFLIAKHPQTKASLETIKKYENLILSQDKLVKEAVKNSEIKKF
jgi:tRNA uracil 4-sulfurtransferase